MIEAAAANSWIDRRAVALEALRSIHRAGADVILTYYGTEAARLAPRAGRLTPPSLDAEKPHAVRTACGFSPFNHTYIS